jgi:hypothetical protein
MKTKSLIAGLAISMAVMSFAMASELSTMEGIPGEAMLQEDMQKIEGKGYPNYFLSSPLSLYGFSGVSLPGIFNSNFFPLLNYYEDQVANIPHAATFADFGNSWNLGFRSDVTCALKSEFTLFRQPSIAVLN